MYMNTNRGEVDVCDYCKRNYQELHDFYQEHFVDSPVFWDDCIDNE